MRVHGWFAVGNETCFQFSKQSSNVDLFLPIFWLLLKILMEEIFF